MKKKFQKNDGYLIRCFNGYTNQFFIVPNVRFTSMTSAKTACLEIMRNSTISKLTFDVIKEN